jgi:hypothetical protein
MGSLYFGLLPSECLEIEIANVEFKQTQSSLYSAWTAGLVRERCRGRDLTGKGREWSFVGVVYC